MRLIVQDVNHLKLRNDLLWIGTITLVTVVIWIAYAIYAAYNLPVTDPQVEELIKPLNPSLDQATLTTLENRFTPPEDFTILVVVGDDSSQTTVPISARELTASPSASLTVSPTPSTNTSPSSIPTPQPTSGSVTIDAGAN